MKFPTSDFRQGNFWISKNSSPKILVSKIVRFNLIYIDQVILAFHFELRFQGISRFNCSVSNIIGSPAIVPSHPRSHPLRSVVHSSDMFIFIFDSFPDQHLTTSSQILQRIILSQRWFCTWKVEFVHFMITPIKESEFGFNWKFLKSIFSITKKDLVAKLL